MKIGFIGENKNDKEAISNLLSQSYSFEFYSILNRLTGDQIESSKFLQLIIPELANNNFDMIIVIRDLDGLKSEKAKIKKRYKWYIKLKEYINFQNTIFLLNIYELEALIFSDLKTYNSLVDYYIENSENPMNIIKPKYILKKKTRYNEGKAPDIFKNLKIVELIKNCDYFHEFIKKEFEPLYYDISK